MSPPSKQQSFPSSDAAHTVDRRFVEYYVEQSARAETVERFLAVQERALALWSEVNARPATKLRVLDIGCGAGTSSRQWAMAGHSVHGIDISADLIEVARERAAEHGLHNAEFSVRDATRLPFDSGSVDICVMPELLEHVPDWTACTGEAMRVLKPGGVLYLSTTNTLCPAQNEYTLPLYSWYPAPLKRWCERRAVTDRPQWVNYARYPAVNWFTYFGLRRYFANHGFDCRDRFDMAAAVDGGRLRALVLRLLRLPPVRPLAHMATTATIVYAIKRVPC